MSRFRYIIRHSRGKSWAVDEWEKWGQLKCKNRTWYFPTEEEAENFKKRKVAEEQ